MKNPPIKKILAIFIFLGSILLTSCNSYIKSESNINNLRSKSKDIVFLPASRDEMNLYRQIGISYFCLARQAKVKFSQSISIAANNFALIVSKKHGGLIEELGDEKLTNNQIYKGSYLQIVEGAIQVCPTQIPEEEKDKFLKAVQQLDQEN